MTGGVVSTSAVKFTTVWFSFSEVSRAKTCRVCAPALIAGRVIFGAKLTLAPVSRRYHHAATSASGLATVSGTAAAGYVPPSCGAETRITGGSVSGAKVSRSGW